uniref:GUN4 domain-containing protein n=1 Tax=Desertifilum tharense IPPAS B-1220 TaxID=1781255 RepID=A0ACD5GNP1_9CYAN
MARSRYGNRKANARSTRKEAEAWLEIADIDNFPGEDLHILDQLWLNYSKGRFGFSVQAQIYRSLGEPETMTRKSGRLLAIARVGASIPPGYTILT